MTDQRVPPRHRGRMASAEWVERVNHAIKNIDDCMALNRNPLARLVYVERVASSQYNGRLCSRGLALRQLVLGCVAQVLDELDTEPGLAKTRTFLSLYSQGVSVTEVSRRMGLSCPHVSSRYRKKAMQMVTAMLMERVSGGRGKKVDNVLELL